MYSIDFTVHLQKKYFHYVYNTFQQQGNSKGFS